MDTGYIEGYTANAAYSDFNSSNRHTLQDGRHFHIFGADEHSVLVTTLYATCGLASVIFNGHMFILYLRYPKLKQTVSPALSVLFVFCLVKGVVNGVFLNILINRLHDIPIWFCIVAQLTIRFCNDFFLLLIPILAIERYISIHCPYLPRYKLVRFTNISSILSAVFVAITGLLPYATFFPSTLLFDRKTHQHASDLRYHQAISCDNKLNSFAYTPLIEIILQIGCVLTVSIVYLKMFLIAKERLKMFSAMTEVRKEKMKRAAKCIVIVTSTFLVLTLPEGILLQLASLCNNDSMSEQACAPLTNSLLHGFSIVATSASFIAPVIFTTMNPKLRKGLTFFHKRPLTVAPIIRSSLSPTA